MAIDPDVAVELRAIEERLAALEARPVGGADPLLDALSALDDAYNDAQDGMTREDRVTYLLREADRVRAG